MNDRDRLIKLVEDGFPKRYEILLREDIEELADHLLANGVIVPPCKVGDTIYKLILFKDGHGSCVPKKVVGFHLGEFPHIRGKERKQYIVVYHEVVNNISHIDIKQLGKTVFLTKEDAEAKLKELSNNE